MDVPPVMPCPGPLRAAALRRLFAASDTAQQESLALAIAAADAEGESAWRGLFVAGETPDAAIWVQPAAGHTAVLWPPEPNHAAAAGLFRAAAAFVDAQRFGVAQLIVSEHDGFRAEELARQGFALLAQLLYLYADLRTLPRDCPPLLHSPQFHAHAAEDLDAFATLVESTYAGSLDCPALDGVRMMADVLAGYRAQGEYLPQHWYRVTDDRHQGRDLGVLILAAHTAARNWELVYMGVTPAGRGRRLGQRIVEFALDAAMRGGAERLVLAVDANNAPAVEMYRRSGFVAWDRRTVYARLAGSTTIAGPR